MSRHVLSTLLALAVVVALVGVALPASAATTDVAIRSVTASTDQPAPGESFTLAVEVANLQSSTGPVDVTDVYVRTAGTATEHARIEDVGTVAAGSSLTVPLTMHLDRLGGKRLTVTAVLEDGDGNVTRVSYPVYVEVREPDEAVLSVAALDPVAGQETTANVTVGNGDSATLSNVQLELGGDATVADPERVSASLPAGSQATFGYRVTFPDAGRQTLAATLTYTTSEGYTRTIERTTTVTVDPATVDAEVTASVDAGNGSAAIRASLTAFGNVELRDGQIRAVVANETVARALVPDVAPKSTRTVTLDASDVPPGTVRVVAAFTAAGERRTAETSLRYSPAPSSAIRLTGVEISRLGSRLTVNGSATNVGSSPAESVLLSVADTPSVRPDAPDGEAFVGGVGPSASVPFALTANASGDVATIPVVVEYTVDGERLSEVVQLDARAASASSVSITLTGIAVTRSDGVLTLNGDAANVGTAAADSLLLSVVPSPDVRPVNPKKEYFVGTVDASEFATFELTANATGTVSEIPVQVAYTVDGTRLTEVVRVDVSDPGTAAEQSGGGFPLLPVGLALIAGLVVGAAVYRWRRA
jgi:hypothetical protein